MDRDSELPINTILQGDVRIIMPALPDQSVNCIVTSPPYWGLRDYGTAQWIGGDADCNHIPQRHNPAGNSTLSGGKNHCGHTHEGYRGDSCPKCGAIREDNQIGLESTPEEYVQTMVGIFRELRRVLRDDGTLWLVLGDSYSQGGRKQVLQTKNASHGLEEIRGQTPGIPPKQLLGIPWRVALALQADGWYLRSDIIWSKPNPMPENVTDRPTKEHEYIFLLAKNERYYYDAEVIKEPIAESTVGRGPVDFGGAKGRNYNPKPDDPNFRNGKEQWGRTFDYTISCINGRRNKRTVWEIPTQPYPEAHFATFPPDLIQPCILAGCPPSGLVLDPFFGSGTVGQVCIETGRNWLGIELNRKYVELAHKRIAGAQPALIAPVGNNGKNEPELQQLEIGIIGASSK